MSRGSGVKTIEGEIGGFADPHAGVTKEQKHIGLQVIAAEQLLLNGLILFGG